MPASMLEAMHETKYPRCPVSPNTSTSVFSTAAKAAKANERHRVGVLLNLLLWFPATLLRLRKKSLSGPLSHTLSHNYGPLAEHSHVS